jgi:hypothetical protein
MGEVMEERVECTMVGTCPKCGHYEDKCLECGKAYTEEEMSGKPSFAGHCPRCDFSACRWGGIESLGKVLCTCGLTYLGYKCKSGAWRDYPGAEEAGIHHIWEKDDGSRAWTGYDDNHWGKAYPFHGQETVDELIEEQKRWEAEFEEEMRHHAAHLKVVQ